MFDKSKITNIFWDLDHTLWDYPTNARLTVFELFEKYKLNELTKHKPEVFHNTYCHHNDAAWDDYRDGKIDKQTLRKLRFSKTFTELGIENEKFHEIFENEFVEKCPTKGNLMSGALEMLRFFEKDYKQHIITNGFKETQEIKLKTSGIFHFFSTITNSEDVGVQKPNPQIFKSALSAAATFAENSLMVGDNFEADILGAYNLGFNCIFFNHDSKKIENIPKEIVELNDLNDVKNYF
ncbi:MAG: noncanonical pyrimidine nucleotidase, YjjG family [Bacteroidetes bacterium]|nr:noncanonical pyrimidine nucleotidase, YjjG family [Bacteroidota bacterium]